jgi:hypothetical protein
MWWSKSACYLLGEPLFSVGFSLINLIVVWWSKSACYLPGEPLHLNQNAFGGWKLIVVQWSRSACFLPGEPLFNQNVTRFWNGLEMEVPGIVLYFNSISTNPV